VSVVECVQPSGAFVQGARHPASETDGLNREILEGKGMKTGQLLLKLRELTRIPIKAIKAPSPIFLSDNLSVFAESV
jgi:hypothetical protein